MKFLGIELKRTEKEDKASPIGYVTQYANQNGVILDGKEIARNNRTYGIMFRINPDIRRCVIEIQQTTAKSGYETHKLMKTTANEKVVTVEEFESALGKSGGFRHIKNEMIKNLAIFANAFIRKHNNARKQAIKYSVLDSRYVSIITDFELNPLRYQYSPPIYKGKIEEFLPEEIIHVKELIDIDNPLFGISIMETLVLDVMGDEQSGQSNYYFFANDNIPAAVYVLKDGLTKEQQQDQMKIIGDGLKGGHNKHKALVSGAVNDVKPIRQVHDDMNFKEQRKFTTERICAAMGVPRTILGYIEDVNHSNGESQYEKFIENTIRPWERLVEEIFTLLVQDFQPDAIFVINDEHIDDLQKRSTLARDNVNSGLWTRNEARDYLGYEKSVNEYADELTVPTTQQLIDNLANGDTTQPVGTPTEPLPPAA